MREPLNHAPQPRRYRRAAFIGVLTIPVLVASYVLALPKFRAFRDHQARRADVRRQFATEIANARQALQATDLNAAALALFNAEFPTRFERHLFWQSEITEFDRQLASVRPNVLPPLAKRHAEQEREHFAAEAARKRYEEERRQRGGIDMETHCSFFGEWDARERTVRDLHDRAMERLRLGDAKNTLAICQQIVVLDPAHEFNDTFWTNVQPKP